MSAWIASWFWTPEKEVITPSCQCVELYKRYEKACEKYGNTPKSIHLVTVEFENFLARDAIKKKSFSQIVQNK